MSAIIYWNGKLFIKILCQIVSACRTIRELFKDKVPFNWHQEHQEVLKLMKKEIARAPILAYYNPRKQTVLQTDASIKGLGACLLQMKNWYITEAQNGYVAIEIDSLAVAWTMKFHHFLYASPFILGTDQKPLEAALSKSLNQATPRLQRILITIFPYHFTAHYLPGVTNHLANCLSRLGGQKDTIKLPKLHLYQITNQLCTRSDSLNQLRVSTSR